MRGYCLWRYQYILRIRAEAEAWAQWNLTKAAATLEHARELYQNQPTEPAYVSELEKIRDVLHSQDKWREQRGAFEERQKLWFLAQPLLVQTLASYEAAAFQTSGEGKLLEIRDGVFREERERLVEVYTREVKEKEFVLMQGMAEPQARRIVDKALRLAGAASFVSRKKPVLFDSKTGRFRTVTELHIAGCPWSLEDRSLTLAFGMPTAIAPSDPNLFIKVNNPTKALEEGVLPCQHCRPDRWAAMSPKLRIEARRQVGQLCCNSAAPDREVGRNAMVALAKFATDDDIPIISRVLNESPYWDLRTYAACTLGSIASVRSVVALREAEKKEPFYFVRHFIQAARMRAALAYRLAQVQAAFGVSEERTRAGHSVEARKTLESMSRQVDQDENVPTVIKGSLQDLIALMIAKLYVEAGEIDRAIHCYRDLLRNDENPNAPLYYNELGYLLAQHDRDLVEAERFIRKAIELDRRQRNNALGAGLTGGQDTPTYMDSLGFVLLKQRRYSEAKKVLLDATRHSGGQYLDIYDHLGDVHLALGEKAEAVRFWKKALTLSCSDEHDRERKAVVKQKLKAQE